MFKLAALLTIISVSASLVAAGGDVKLCADESLQGDCETLHFLNDVCYNFDSTLSDELSSVNPIGSNIKCILYKNDDCSGATYDFTKRHNTLPGFNDVASSISCTTT